MHRFFVPPDSIDDGRAILPEEVAGQLTRVLRAQSGYEITVLDDSGWEYLVELDHVESKHAEGRVKDRRRCRGEVFSRRTGPLSMRELCDARDGERIRSRGL